MATAAIQATVDEAQSKPLVGSPSDVINPPTNWGCFVVLQFLWSFGFAAALPWIVALTPVPCWTIKSWWVGTILTAFLWEMWITMALGGGLPLSVRIPGGAKDWLNWFLMSAGDSFLILHVLMMGSALLLVPVPEGEPWWSLFTQWDWRVLVVMWVTGYFQNPVMTILLEKRGASLGWSQKMCGTRLSWYPLAPTLPSCWEAAGYPCSPLCRVNQCWLLMPPLWYAFLIHGVAGTPLPCPLVTLTAIVVLLCAYMLYFANVWPSRANLGGTTPWEEPGGCPEGGTNPQVANVPTMEYWDRWEVHSWLPQPSGYSGSSVLFAVIVPFAIAAVLQGLSVLILWLSLGPEAYSAAFGVDCTLRCEGWPLCQR